MWSTRTTKYGTTNQAPWASNAFGTANASAKLPPIATRYRSRTPMLSMSIAFVSHA